MSASISRQSQPLASREQMEQEWDDFKKLLYQKNVFDDSGYKAVKIIEKAYESVKLNKVIKI